MTVERMTVRPNPDLDIEITYRKEGDYWVPDLEGTSEPKVQLNKFGYMRKEFLMNHRRVDYEIMMIEHRLNEHLAEIQEKAWDRVHLLVAQMAKAQGVTEELKARDMLGWVQQMNNIQAAAEEIVKEELIYS